MGKLKLSALLTSMGGKFGGSVVQGGPSGLIIRNNNWKKPQRYPKWQLQKGRFSWIVRTWRTLTPIQQTAWQAMTASYPATDRFGDVYIPSGFQLYTTLNGSRVAAGLALLTTPVAPGILFDAGTVTVGMGGLSNLDVSITNPIAVNSGIFIRASKPQSQGSQIRLGNLSSMSYEIDPLVLTYTIEVPYLAKWGQLLSGSRIWVRVESILETTGQTGNFQYGYYDVP